MPINCGRLYTPVSFNGISPLATSVPYDKQQENATENMQRVPAGHSKENTRLNTIGNLQMAKEFNTKQFCLQAKYIPLKENNPDQYDV